MDINKSLLEDNQKLRVEAVRLRYTISLLEGLLIKKKGSSIKHKGRYE